MKKGLIISKLSPLLIFTFAIMWAEGYSQTPEYVPGEVLVKFKPGILDISGGVDIGILTDAVINSTQLDSLMRSVGVSSVERVFKGSKNMILESTNPAGETARMPDLSNIIKLTFPASMDVTQVSEALELLPDVLYAEPNYIGHIQVAVNDPLFASQWHLGSSHTRASNAWDITTGNSSTKIGILDTGVEYLHRDLGNGPIPNGKVTGGDDLVNPDSDPADDNGHGTAVAGIISAVTNNNTDIAGINWNAKLLAYKVCDSYGDCPADAVANGAYAANNAGARVINISLGFSDYPAVLAEAMKSVYLSGNSPILCAAMGNTNENCKEYPSGLLRTAFAVGAYVRTGDRWDEWPGFCYCGGCGSSWGNWIDVSAPGGAGIVTLDLSNQTQNDFGGTSAAAPMVSGVASLVVPLGKFDGYPGLTNDDVENIIRLTARDWGDPGFDPEYGFGKIDAYSACSLATLPNTFERCKTSDPNCWISPIYNYGGEVGPYSWIFYNLPPGFPGGPVYAVKTQEVRADITFHQEYFVTPHVWVRAVGTNGAALNNPYDVIEQVPYGEAINLTTTGCVLRTHVFRIFTQGGDEWYPCRPEEVQFAYTIAGERELVPLLGYDAFAQVGPPNRITTHWRDCNGNEEGFKVKRKIYGEPDFSVISTLEPFYGNCTYDWTGYSDYDVTGSETYVYKAEVFTKNQSLETNEETVTNVPHNPRNLSGYVTQVQCGGFGFGPEGMQPEGMGPGYEYCYTNKIILSWQAPLNQKAGTIDKYKILIEDDASGWQYWFEAPGTQLSDTICMGRNDLYNIWVYTYDTYGQLSIPSNILMITTGSEYVCEPPANERVWLPQEENGEPKSEMLPTEFGVRQNYPNPFNLTTQVTYSLPQDSKVQIDIYDILGRKVQTFDLGYQVAGIRTLTWDGTDEQGRAVPSGTYLYRLRAGTYTETKKMTLLK